LQLSLSELPEESSRRKVSVSAHVHRDGSVHLALTEKTSGKSDQATLNGPAEEKST
jgi:hypothetical protein